jgi:hypothetical protein
MSSLLTIRTAAGALLMPGRWFRLLQPGNFSDSKCLAAEQAISKLRAPRPTGGSVCALAAYVESDAIRLLVPGITGGASLQSRCRRPFRPQTCIGLGTGGGVAVLPACGRRRNPAKAPQIGFGQKHPPITWRRLWVGVSVQRAQLWVGRGKPGQRPYCPFPDEDRSCDAQSGQSTRHQHPAQVCRASFIDFRRPDRWTSR